MKQADLRGILYITLQSRIMAAGDRMHQLAQTEKVAHMQCLSASREHFFNGCKVHNLTQAEIENFKCDTDDLNSMLKYVKRQSVKEVIQANLNLLTAKTESLKDMAVEELRNDLGWIVAGKGRKKKLQLILHGAQPIPFIHNRFEPRNNSMNHELDTFNLTVPLQKEKNQCRQK